MPRLFRQSPLNAIWEGSGNVIALDVLRAIAREPEGIEALHAFLAAQRGRDAAYDAWIDTIDLRAAQEGTARRNVARLNIVDYMSTLARTAKNIARKKTGFDEHYPAPSGKKDGDEAT